MSDSWAPIFPNFLVILDADFRVGGKIPNSNNFFSLSFKLRPIAFLSLQINSSVFLSFTKHDSESTGFNSKDFLNVFKISFGTIPFAPLLNSDTKGYKIVS